MKKTMNVALLIIGFDGYKDVWDSYFYLLNKYWDKNERPKTYLLTSELTPHYDGVITIAAGKGAEWSTKTRVGVENIKEDYVVLLLEDFFTTRKVDTKKLQHVVEIMQRDNLKYCRILDQKRMYGPKYKGEKHILIIPRKDKYGICLEPGIWNKEFLREMVGTENYNPWLFEFKMLDLQLHNKDRIDTIQENSNILEITHGIVQSQYLPQCIRIFKRQGYEFDLSHRKVFSFKDNFKYRLKCFVNFHSPEWSKPFLKSIGRAIGVDFVSDRIKGKN